MTLKTRWICGIIALAALIGLAALPGASQAQTTVTYPVVDTGQTTCYDDGSAITCPAAGEPFYGQDAQFTGNAPSTTDNGDGTVTDHVTGLTWQQSPDTDGDGDIDAQDKLTYADAVAYCENLTLEGADDWWLPSIKQLYSLIDFSGADPSGRSDAAGSNLSPFIDATTFRFAYGDEGAGERLIDAQFASSTPYVATVMNDRPTIFGVNFVDGRIKGYPQDLAFYVLCVRGNAAYGENDLVDNGDGTITDQATGLMWTQDDSGSGMTWEEALDWVEAQNAANYLGYSDWRLPDVKELQSIVDYARSPDTTNSAAIDPVFDATAITNEAGEIDYAFYWSSTTHANLRSGGNAAYVAFGRGLGYMNGSWIDVHGAGCQRSDPKSGDPGDWPEGNGPQGDAIRIYNFVRLVRDADTTAEPTATPDPNLEPKLHLPIVMVNAISASR